MGRPSMSAQVRWKRVDGRLVHPPVVLVRPAVGEAAKLTRIRPRLPPDTRPWQRPSGVAEPFAKVPHVALGDIEPRVQGHG